MRLSEDIRLGDGLHPQTWDEVQRQVGGKIYATCAIGAALEVNGVTDGNAILEIETTKLWPWITRKIACPMCSEISTIFSVICYHLGADDYPEGHCWTRSQIADWVATIEPQDVPTPEPVKEACEPAGTLTVAS